jgi:hypothetical protein
VDTTSDHPVKSKAYPLPYSTDQIVKKEIQKMLQLDIIEPCTSPYASPVVIVEKSDKTHRFCVDYRKLNRITIFDAEPLSDPRDLYVQFERSRYFTKIDLASGYWQIPVRRADRPKTAFICKGGLFQWKRMPFGMVNAGATFTKLMRDVLRDCQFVIHYIDDILIHTITWEDHVRTIEEVLSRLRRAELTAKPSKCSIGNTTIPFLGRMVGQKCMEPLEKNVSKIIDAEPPHTKKQLRSFLGMCNYYRSFIPNFSAIAVPLTDLTRAGLPNTLKWEEIHGKAFISLKHAIGSEPILRLPDYEKKFILQVDASNIAMGATLMQETDATLMPIEYASKKFLPREKAYSTIEKECYAIFWATTHFQKYLYNVNFILQTDHKPLEFLQSAKLENSRVARWALSLQPYRFTLQSIPGKLNHVADWLSRMENDTEEL